MAAVHIHQLRQAQSAAVHHLQHRAVAHRQRIVKVDLQQLIHFVDVDVLRQMARVARRGDPFGGIGGEFALADLPVEKAAQRRQTQREAAGA